jgi:hypothetical protein
VILRAEPAPNPGVGVELVTSLNGDLSRRRDGVRYSMSPNGSITDCCSTHTMLHKQSSGGGVVNYCDQTECLLCLHVWCKVTCGCHDNNILSVASLKLITLTPVELGEDLWAVNISSSSHSGCGIHTLQSVNPDGAILIGFARTSKEILLYLIKTHSSNPASL